MMEEPIAKKVYYSIGEVCDLTGLKPHVLRYWETQFEVLHPTKNRAGNRVFRPKEIELILLVKHLLYEKKFTIDGARQKLRDMRRRDEVPPARQEVVDQELLTGVRQELQHRREVLTAPPIRVQPSCESSPPTTTATLPRECRSSPRRRDSSARSPS